MINVSLNIIIKLIALLYAYGAFVHLVNIIGLNGFNWLDAPFKWQVLDIVYLILDMMIAVGLFRAWKPAYGLFYLAALSQIALYTIFRRWITDVPEPFGITPQQLHHLDSLVLFHSVTLILMTLCLLIRKLTVRAPQEKYD